MEKILAAFRKSRAKSSVKKNTAPKAGFRKSRAQIPFGKIVLWFYDFMFLWFYGFMILCFYGFMVL
jgi:hypothetical protein